MAYETLEKGRVEILHVLFSYTHYITTIPNINVPHVVSYDLKC